MVMGVTWVASIAIYGRAVGFMGKLGNSAGWAITMGCCIAASNIWGMALGEWRQGKGKPLRTMCLGLAVILDVVYNHLGPEGNYLAEYGPYFTDRHQTPWGQAINFDDSGSDEVRRFFIENALHWIEAFHVDALRLDAVHAMYDFSARPFLQELADAVRLEGERLNRRVYTIAESSLGDARLITPKELGGCGIDAQWCDDLHHALRTALRDERSAYYADYHGFEDLVKAYRDGFVQDGRYSEYRGRRHGNSARHIAPLRLVVCSLNHGQVGALRDAQHACEAAGLVDGLDHQYFGYFHDAILCDGRRAATRRADRRYGSQRHAEAPWAGGRLAPARDPATGARVNASCHGCGCSPYRLTLAA